MKFNKKFSSSNYVDWNVQDIIYKGNFIGIAFGILLFFLPFKYFDSMFLNLIYKGLKIINILIPIIAIYLAIKYKWVSVCNVKNANNIKNPLYITVGIMIFIPSIFLAMRGVADYHLEPTKAFWAYGIVLATILVAIIIKNTSWDKSPKTTFVLFFIMIIYSFGVLQEINCGFLKTKESIQDTIVLDMVHKGRAHYDIRVIPEDKDNEWISVSPEVYSRIHQNDVIKIVEYRGMLGIRWHTVEF